MWSNPAEDLYEELNSFCQRHNIPINYIVRILEDQKVIPMLRGKALEFHVYEFLRNTLPDEEWTVEKFNVNPQPGSSDADLVVTHKDTKIEVIVESKHSVRGSFSEGSSRGRTPDTQVPHFRVKCHKSRSNMDREITNDRYFVDDFDVIFTSAENAFILSGGEYALMDTPYLASFYGIDGQDRDKALTIVARDIRAALTTDLAQSDGTIPRMPVVQLLGDPHWRRSTDDILEIFNTVVTRKMAARQRRPSVPAHHRIGR